VIVVDNVSRDNSLELLRKHHPNAEVITNSVNAGFGRANNQALGRARGRYVLLLNTDAFVSPDTLPKTVQFMDAHPECGVLGVKLVGEDGSLQPSCRYFPTPWNLFLASTGLHWLFPKTRLVDDMTWDHASIRECDWVPGCYYLVRREVIDRIGLFDPRFFLYFEEVDHCRAVRKAGWRVIFYPYTEVVHIGGESAASAGRLTREGRQLSALQIESELLYFRKHYGLAGVLVRLLLDGVAQTIKACRAVLRGDIGKATEALQYSRMKLHRFFLTKLAARETR
jgi:N-acetylglucosaminyl-diphospho-decaprenol L-rhamnosyltransferase